MLIPEIMTRRTEDVEVVHWGMESDGEDIELWVTSNTPEDWIVARMPWRTVSASDANGETGFTIDRGEYLVRTSDGKIIRTTTATLELFFR